MEAVRRRAAPPTETSGASDARHDDDDDNGKGAAAATAAFDFDEAPVSAHAAYKPKAVVGAVAAAGRGAAPLPLESLAPYMPLMMGTLGPTSSRSHGVYLAICPVVMHSKNWRRGKRRETMPASPCLKCSASLSARAGWGPPRYALTAAAI